MAAAIVVLAVAIVGRAVSSVAAFSAYPAPAASPPGRGALLAGGGLVVAALAPFADRRGIER